MAEGYDPNPTVEPPAYHGVPDGYYDGIVDKFGNLTDYGKQLEAQGKVHRTGNGAVLVNGGTPAPGSPNANGQTPTTDLTQYGYSDDALRIGTDPATGKVHLYAVQRSYDPASGTYKSQWKDAGEASPENIGAIAADLKIPVGALSSRLQELQVQYGQTQAQATKLGDYTIMGIGKDASGNEQWTLRSGDGQTIKVAADKLLGYQGMTQSDIDAAKATWLNNQKTLNLQGQYSVAGADPRNGQIILAKGDGTKISVAAKDAMGFPGVDPSEVQRQLSNINYQNFRSGKFQMPGTAGYQLPTWYSMDSGPSPTPPGTGGGAPPATPPTTGPGTPTPGQPPRTGAAVGTAAAGTPTTTPTGAPGAAPAPTVGTAAAAAGGTAVANPFENVMKTPYGLPGSAAAGGAASGSFDQYGQMRTMQAPTGIKPAGTPATNTYSDMQQAYGNGGVSAAVMPRTYNAQGGYNQGGAYATQYQGGAPAPTGAQYGQLGAQPGYGKTFNPQGGYSQGGYDPSGGAYATQYQGGATPSYGGYGSSLTGSGGGGAMGGMGGPSKGVAGGNQMFTADQSQTGFTESTQGGAGASGTGASYPNPYATGRPSGGNPTAPWWQGLSNEEIDAISNQGNTGRNIAAMGQYKDIQAANNGGFTATDYYGNRVAKTGAELLGSGSTSAGELYQSQLNYADLINRYGQQARARQSRFLGGYNPNQIQSNVAGM